MCAGLSGSYFSNYLSRLCSLSMLDRQKVTGLYYIYFIDLLASDDKSTNIYLDTVEAHSCVDNS